MKKKQRKLPLGTQIYAYGANDYRDDPCCGDIYNFDKMAIVVSKVTESEVIFYKNGIRKTICRNEFRHMIRSIVKPYQFKCHHPKERWEESGI